MRSETPNGVPQEYDAGTAAIAAELGHHTGLLEQLVGRRPAAHLEDAQTFAFPTATASAFLFTPGVPPTGEVEIEAWQAGSAAVPLFILDGQYTEAQAGGLVSATASDFVPVVFAVPTVGIGRVRRPSFSGKLTICSLGAPTAVSLVTVKVRACES